MFTDFLDWVGRVGVARVKEQLVKDGKVVSGETYNSIKYVVGTDGVEIRANASILTLIKGRGATSNNGSGDVRRNIERWAKAKGIPKSAVGAIVRSIHEKGVKVPNRYTDGKLLIRAFDGFQQEINKEFLKLWQ